MSLQHRIRSTASTPVQPVAKKSAEAGPAVTGKKRGPKPSGEAKTLISLRLDPAVIAKFKATGPGWQRLINAVLAKASL